MLKGDGSGPLPPLLQQYVELREQYPDYLLLFQVGDFYECFGEDAEKLARTLGLILTHKTSRDFTTPMAGIPLRAADSHIERLLAQGLRVAVADQVETPAMAEGLVKRDVTQLITPGTITQDSLLLADANYLAAIATGNGYGLSLLDISTGEFRGTHLYSQASLLDELQRYRPAEILLAPELWGGKLADILRSRYALMRAQGFEAEGAAWVLEQHFGYVPESLAQEALRCAAGAVLSYALETQRGVLPQVSRFLHYDPGASMHLDETALSTLEIFSSPSGEANSLFGVLDQTRTAPGRRLLKAWLRHPLLERTLIEGRQDAVAAFVHDTVLRQDIRKALYRIHDLERLATRLVSGRAAARDLSALARSLSLIPEIRKQLAGHVTASLQVLNDQLPDMQELQVAIDAALVTDPPQKLTDGGLVNDGFDERLDNFRQQIAEGRSWIAQLELRERQATGISSLRVGFNQVFGYYLEVSRSHYAQIPPHYQAIQTLKDRQRYTLPELRDKEREILRAEDAAKQREYQVFCELRDSLIPCAETIRELARSLAELDVYSSLAEVAAQQQYCRPVFTEHLCIQAGRHAVVEQRHAFIANDISMGSQERLIVLTGPNMSGKSTYLRQNALICLLAQIGSFVPAERAELPIFKRIYTRIGAQDDIAGGRSTFMVEMSELAQILQNADAESLVLLDEIGRGTSTYDGLALAWAACEYLHDASQSYTLFATHYFELTSLPDKLSSARNYHVAAHEEARGLIFYHQVVPGPASKSYGLQVAKLAGVPQPVLKRAQRVFSGLESLRDDRQQRVLDSLLSADVSQLSPLEALKLLYQLQEEARGLSLNAS